MAFVKKKRGFTLIELLVVIAIIGILAVMPLNAFRSAYDHAQVRVAAERLLSILQEAKANAQSHSDACYGVQITDATTITTVKASISDGVCSATSAQSTEILYHNLSVTSTASEILFLPPHGMVYNSAALTDPVLWVLSTPDGYQAQLQLNVAVSTLSLVTPEV